MRLSHVLRDSRPALPMGAVRWLADRVPAVARLRAARDELLAQRDGLSAELARVGRRDASRFLHYNAVFDAEAMVRRHAAPAPAPRAGHFVNFLDVAVDVSFYPDILAGHGGLVEPLPLPCNWHADLAEWGAALRAVDLARGRFVVVELGCGWGCWLNNTGRAARRAGMSVRLIGIEGDRGHLAFAREAAATNGFEPETLTLHHGIAAATGGNALFPTQDRSGEAWGLAPRFGASEAESAAAIASGAWEVVPMRTLAEIAAGEARIDLLHVDIQGGEDALLAGGLAFLDAHVAYLVVGTHSRPIEGRIIDRLGQAGWVLEIERPAFLTPDDLLRGVIVDGVQGWRNPKLAHV